jgi:creatinine amidohydrolase/Fe(II)-dependent formamide hydrolase-like protein
MLALAPDLVRIDLAEPGAVEGWPELRDRVLAGGVGSVSPNGVLGDPTGATAAEGRGLLDDLVARSLATVRAALNALVDPVDPAAPSIPPDPARLHG